MHMTKRPIFGKKALRILLGLAALVLIALVGCLIWAVSAQEKVWTTEEVKNLVSSAAKPHWKKQDVVAWVKQQEFAASIFEDKADGLLLTRIAPEKYGVDPQAVDSFVCASIRGRSAGLARGEIIHVYFFFDENKEMLKYAVHTFEIVP